MNKRNSCKNVSKIISYDMVIKKETNSEIGLVYYIMPRYDYSLEDLVAIKTLHPIFYYEMAHELIDSLESLHATGRTYNDMKPENVMFEGSKVILVDFGMTDRFVDKNKKHCSETEEVDNFKGNIIFASIR